MKRVLTLLCVFAASLLWAETTDADTMYVRFAMPGHAGYFSCDSSSILLMVHLSNGFMDPWSSMLQVFRGTEPLGIDSVMYSRMDSPLDSFYWFSPRHFSDGDSITIIFLPAFGHRPPDLVFSGDTSWYFFVDLTDPTMSLISPPAGVPPSTMLNLRMLIQDALAGVSRDSSTVTVTVRGTDNWNTRFNFNASAVSVVGDTFAFNLNSLGTIRGGDTVRACVSAADRAVGCGANRADTCFTWTLPYTPPDIVLIYPFNGAIMADPCSDSIVFRINDVDSISNITVTIGATTISLGDPRMTVTGGRVRVNTSGIFSDGNFYSIRIYCNDVYLIQDELTFGVWTDFSEPVVMNTTPPSGSLIADTVIHVSLQLLDLLSGVNPGSVTVTVGAVPVTGFTYDTTTNTVRFDRYFAGITDTATIILTICVNANDMPNFCVNSFDTCYDMTYTIDVREPEFYPPDGTVSACSAQNLVMALFSYGGLDSTTALLQVRDIDSGSIRNIPWTDPRFLQARYDAAPYGVIDSFFFNPSAGFWADGVHYRLTLSGTVTELGGPSSKSYDWDFYTDFSPPYLTAVSPAEGATVMATPDSLIFRLGDTASGIVDASVACTLFVDGTHYHIPFATLVRSGDRFALPFARYGIDINGCDSIALVVRASDAVSAIYCGPNTMTDTIFFRMDCTMPSATLIEPVMDEILSCMNQRIAFTLGADANLDSTSIMLDVNGVSYALLSPELYVAAPNTLFFVPSSPWTEGDTVSGFLHELCDRAENCSARTYFSFVVDTMPPVITPIYPLPGATITDSLATFRVRIEDAFTSLSSYDLDADFATAFNYEAAPQYFYNPTLPGGNPLGREETVYVTITAADDAARCGVNETELSYWFIVDAIGPRVERLDTVVGTYTSCANRCIGFELTDMLGVNRFFTHLYTSHTAETLSASSPELVITDSTVRYCPTVPFTDGENVTITLVSAPDRAGNPLFAGAITENFTVDLSAPIVSVVSPVTGVFLSTVTPTVEFDATDAISGVNWATLLFTVHCYYGDFTFHYGDAGISILADRFTFSFADAGIFVPGGDSVHVCLTVSDMISDTAAGCLVHTSTMCNHFFIDPTPPTVNAGAPGRNIIITCDSTFIDFTAFDLDGVDWDTLVVSIEGVRYNQSSPQITIIPATDRVVFTPTARFGGERVLICVEYIRDVLGNEIDTAMCWYFDVDTIPPHIVAMTGVCGDTISDTSYFVWATVADVFTDEVQLGSFTLNGAPHTAPDSYFDGDSFACTIAPLPEGRNTFCIELFDVPDTLLCPANRSEFCCTFYVDVTPPNIEAGPESLVSGSCDSFEFSFYAFDVQGVDVVGVFSTGDITYGTELTETTATVNGYASPLSDFGTVDVWAVFADGLGNISSDTVHFSFDLRAPDVEFTTPLDGDIIYGTRTPDIRVSASDVSEINPVDAVINVDGVNYTYGAGQIDWDGTEFSLDLAALGVSLPERSYVTMIVSGIRDTLSGLGGCPSVYAAPETIIVYIADDDTIAPVVVNPDSVSGWCTGLTLPLWTISDSSGISRAIAIISSTSDFAMPETVRLTPVGGGLWTPESPIVLDSDTLWLYACASDADNDPGLGPDSLTTCSAVFHVTCRKPYVEVSEDTLDFGEICVIDSMSTLELRIYNPTGVSVTAHMSIVGSSVFTTTDTLAVIGAGGMRQVVVTFAPLAETTYTAQLLVVLPETTYSVLLIGDGKLCPLGFSAEPRTITPNGDGAYDFTEFTFPLRGNNKVELFSREFFKVRELQSSGLFMQWDGRDDAGIAVPSGAYLFVAFADGKQIAKGIIVVVR